MAETEAFDKYVRLHGPATVGRVSNLTYAASYILYRHDLESEHDVRARVAGSPQRCLASRA